ncbi:MAG: ribonuclease D [Rickettsiales bacterium]|jgi:ribonuclease D
MLEAIKDLLFPIKINHICDNSSLLELCKEAEKHKICAIDTEFMRNRTYYPILCLIQINVNDILYIIDPISYKLNLNPLYKVISNKNIKKVIHSARHDLEVLYFNKDDNNYNNIIDTQIMANFSDLNHNIGYKLLTKKLCSRKLCDESQRSNWKKRPLTDKQMKYAALDVKYLIKIYHKLEKKLKNQNRLSWFNWEMEDFTKKCQNHDSSNPDNLIKRFSTNRKSDTYMRDIKLFAKIRDNASKRVDLPRNFVIHDDLVEKILNDRPKSIEDLSKYKSINKKISDNEKEQIVEIFNLPEIDSDNKSEGKMVKLNKKQLEIYRKIKEVLEKNSKESGIDKSFIISDRNLKMIAAKHLEISDILQNWRLDIFGNKIKKLIP